MVTRTIFLSLLLICAKGLLAQQGYSVIYQYNDRVAPITFNQEKRYLPGPKFRLVFDDSLSFYYYIPNGDPYKKKKIFGEKLLHHARIYNAVTNYYYDEVDWPKGAPQYLVTDTMKRETWAGYEDSKIILGYSCRPALYVSQKNDSTLVWFTDSIPKPFGPTGYLGFPGLVLEVYDQRSGQHITAKKIVSGDFRVVMPKEGTLISPEEFRKRKK